jgi:chitin synthase
MEKALGAMNATYAAQQYTCLRNAFYVGRTDFRDTPRCTVNNYILLAFSVIIMITIGAKCTSPSFLPMIISPASPNAPTHLPPLAVLAALQLSSKRNPEMLDKFVICQVPCYTEGEESLRTTIDSLAALQYDDKRKLMFIICDGNIYGSGNDKPTPRIVLDILGVDEKVEADPLMFKSVAEGSKQINYGKVYSGLYEFEGHVVPCVQPV